MHDLRALRENADAIRDGLRRRGKLDALGPIVDRALAADVERRTLIQAVEERKAARNAASQEVARRKKARESADDLIEQTRALGAEIARLETELASAEAEIERMLFELPNSPLPDVPAGGEDDGRLLRAWGTPREGNDLKPHWDLGTALGILDLARGAKITGSGFVVFRGVGARLTRGLLSMMIDVHVRDHGYEEVWVPFLVNRATATTTGQLPKFEDDMYVVKDDDLYLVPTAEVPVTSLHRDEMLDGAELPKAYVCYTPCFRREAGAHGKDTRGLLRVHQFDKVELVRLTSPEDAGAQHELLTSHAEKILQLLELPYRVKMLAAGDTGFSSAKTYDLEVWAPGVRAWLEVSSCSTFTDFQARRGGIRYRPARGEKPRLVHTLNGSGLALPRTIAALLEHHQRPDGSIAVPPALRPYLGADTLA
ncbi:MAG TPA: serine--tRNA ligase [Gemmatimonadaceae bacterium]|nr:serine--tRNA ligase [Gemmatimonadaceae bacterium]